MRKARWFRGRLEVAAEQHSKIVGAMLCMGVDESGPNGFDIFAITPGEAVGWGWIFSAGVLERSLALWEGVEIFVNHEYDRPGRDLRDLAGVLYDCQYTEGVQGKVRLTGPSSGLLQALGREMLVDGPKPRVGFSADVVFAADGMDVTEIYRVHSVDVVYNPARGGAFIRALNSVGAGETAERNGRNMPNDPVVPASTVTPAAVVASAVNPVTPATSAAPGNTERMAQLESERQHIAALLGAQAQSAELEAELTKMREIRKGGCELLLQSALLSSRLPASLQERVKKQFTGRIFESQELTDAITDARALLSDLTGDGAVVGNRRVHQMYNGLDQLQAAVEDMLDAERSAHLSGVSPRKLSGIKELYLMLTGDSEFHGGFYADRAMLAGTADFTGLVKNALNKVVVNQWNKLGKAGYDWWNRVVVTEHFDSLNTITGILVGTVGLMPSVAEGAEYTELAIGDSPETADFVKYGGYIPLSLELIDRDQTRKLKAYPRELANAGLRRISALVAAIFTANSAVGPTMADTGALFNATAVTTAGGHANLLTTALSAAQFEIVNTAIYNQPMLIKNAAGIYGTGPKQAVNGKYLLVPRALQLAAKQIIFPSQERAANIFSENLQRGDPQDVVTVPEWTDTNDWAVVADPTILPAIFVAERFGIMPEIFIAGDEQSPAVFMNDEHRMKARHFVAVYVNDFRPLHKENV